MKTVAELEEAMATRYTGPTALIQKGKQQRTYIPWTAMARHLNNTFGWDGWGARVVPGSLVYDATHNTYSIALDFEVYVWDERAQAIHTIPRPGVSGKVVLGDDASDAAGGARSLALVNGARSLGDAFGLYLTPDKGEAPAFGGGSSNGHQANSEGEPPTEAQISTLRKCKVPESLIRVATKEQAGTFFNGIFVDKKTGAYKFGRKLSNEEALERAFGKELVATAVGEDDNDLPF